MAIIIGLIGYGHWGEVLHRNIRDRDDLIVKKIFTRSPTHRKGSPYTDLFTSNLQDILSDKMITAVIVSMPPLLSSGIISQSLASGKHVLAEKPACMSVGELQNLIKLSETNKVSFFIDHIDLFNTGFLRCMGDIKPEEIVSLNIEFGRRWEARNDVNVLWEWGPHPLAMAVRTVGAPLQLIETFATPPEKVSESERINNPDADKLFAQGQNIKLLLKSARGIPIEIHIGNGFSRRKRHCVIQTKKGSFFYDDESSQKAFLGDKSLQHSSITPVHNLLSSFIRDCQTEHKNRQVTAEAVEVTRVLCQADQALETKKNSFGGLALYGGPPAIGMPLPHRAAFGCRERDAAIAVAEYYSESDGDVEYHGRFERAYNQAFSDFMGGGFSVAVATGSAALYIALASLNLPAGSEVLISPVTDAGPVSAVIALGLVPVLLDSIENSYNTSWEMIAPRLSDKVRCVMLVHAAGFPAKVDTIALECKKRNILLVEDCSQAPGAKWDGKLVGTFGDVAAFSTMYRKNIASAGSGGTVFCKSENLYRAVVSIADRGKPIWRADYKERDPSLGLYPAHNWNTNEFSCAVAHSSLRRLDSTIRKRTRFLALLAASLQTHSKCCEILPWEGEPSPFFIPVYIHVDKISCGKREFCAALESEGIGINGNYKFLVNDWVWAKSFFRDEFTSCNALIFRENSFNLYLNENFGEQEVAMIIAAIIKIEKVFYAQ